MQYDTMITLLYDDRLQVWYGTGSLESTVESMNTVCCSYSSDDKNKQQQNNEQS
jgi:hypothetical protein